MTNKIRIILFVVLYLLLCMFDYISSNTFDWVANIFQTVIAFVFIWIIIEYPSKKKNNSS